MYSSNYFLLLFPSSKGADSISPVSGESQRFDPLATIRVVLLGFSFLFVRSTLLFFCSALSKEQGLLYGWKLRVKYTETQRVVETLLYDVCDSTSSSGAAKAVCNRVCIR